MFASIEVGLQVYKNTVKDYLKACGKIEEAERQERQADGRDYRGSMDWTPQARDWKKVVEARIRGMEAALGLSGIEIVNIRAELASL